MIADPFPTHTLLAPLPPEQQASDLQYESAVNALLAKFITAQGQILTAAIFKPGFFRWVPYDDLTDDLANGWIPADGTIYPISTYPALAAKLGNKWGGDGITTFAVPNVSDRTIVGYGASATLGTAVGATGGAVNHTHTINAEASHTHAVSGTTASGGSNGAADVCGATTHPFFSITDADNQHTHTFSVTSGPGSSHTHTEGGANQAYAVFKAVIKT